MKLHFNSNWSTLSLASCLQELQAELEGEYHEFEAIPMYKYIDYVYIQLSID